MRDEEAFVIIAVVLGSIGGAIAIFALWQKERRARRQERYELLRTALQQPQLDELTRAELLRAFAREQATNLPRLFGVVRTVWFAIGWLMLVGGGATLLLDAIDVMRVWEAGAACIMVAGFVMLSLPLGLREFNRRERAVADQR